MAVDRDHKHDDYRIALYYCYVQIDNVNHHVSFQKEICGDVLGGRIRVSSEGLNGVLSGSHSSLQEYQRRVEKEIDFHMDVKYCLLRTDLSIEEQLFDSLSVKATREVVSLYEPTSSEVRHSQHPKVSKQGSSNRRRKRNRQKQVSAEDQLPDKPDIPNSPFDDRLASLTPCAHLSPQEWNQHLAGEDGNGALLVDARNCYESRVGYFQVEGVPTLLANTRKYSSLPQVLADRKMDLAGKTVYMYCTGGVRCERASVFLQALDWGEDSPKAVYQLDGGIQRYLEHYGSSSVDAPNDACLFRGKNFVFDPRRTDPVVGKGSVGRCFICGVAHDDYDNGQAPSQENESRCCKCRVLVLVCGTCRESVIVWGEDDVDRKPKLYCGTDRCIDEGNSAQASTVF